LNSKTLSEMKMTSMTPSAIASQMSLLLRLSWVN